MRALTARVDAMLELWDEVLVQRYVDGREINVAILGDTVLPISEIDFAAMPRIPSVKEASVIGDHFLNHRHDLGLDLAEVAAPDLVGVDGQMVGGDAFQEPGADLIGAAASRGCARELERIARQRRDRFAVADDPLPRAGADAQCGEAVVRRPESHPLDVGTERESGGQGVSMIGGAERTFEVLQMLSDIGDDDPFDERRRLRRERFLSADHRLETRRGRVPFREELLDRSAAALRQRIVDELFAPA